MPPPSLTEALSQDFVVTTASPPAPEAARAANLDREIACAWNDESPVLDSLLAQRSAHEEAADPALKARRLRLKASDARATYQRHMDAYGTAIGQSQDRWNRGDITLSTSFAREAAACLACATDCLIEAEKAEHEADRLAQFTVLFDGVSARSDVLSSLQGGM